MGDEIEFTNTENQEDSFKVKVIGLTKASSLNELFEKISPYIAGWDKETTPEKATQDMREYYSQEEEQKYGSLGIHVELFN